MKWMTRGRYGVANYRRTQSRRAEALLLRSLAEKPEGYVTTVWVFANHDLSADRSMTDPSSKIRAVLAAHPRIGGRSLEDRMPIARLGLDSFDLVELIFGVERAMGRELDVDVVREGLKPDTTVEEAIALFRRALTT
jgi:acyl carrier protein